MKTLRIDPVGVLLALLTAAAILVIQGGPVVAVLAAASVIAVAIGAGMAASMLSPTAAVVAAPTPSATPALWYHPLTYRQSQFAELVGDHTNKQIAEILGVGERGVEATVQNIFNKLSDHTKTEFRARAQVAVWVKERQMTYGVSPAKAPPPK